MKRDKKPGQTVQAVDTAFSILEYIKRKEGAGVTELANELGMAKSSIHRYLTSMTENEYVIQEDRQYFLGLRFLSLSTEARNRRAISRIIHPYVRELAETTDERAQFILEEYGRGIYIYLEKGSRAVDTDTQIGKTINLTTAAAGKAILAHYPREKIQNIVDQHGFSQRTENTIMTKNDLFEDLKSTRQRGYAVNREEHIKGLWGVAVPVKTADGAVLGSLSVAGPTHRMKDRVTNGSINDKLLGVANEVELTIEYSN